MQTHIYQYEILKGLGDGTFEAKDTGSGALVTLYEWTPAVRERDSSRRTLEELSGELHSEVFSADASLYLVGRDPAASAEDLAKLRRRGLFLAAAAPVPQTPATVTMQAPAMSRPQPSIAPTHYAASTEASPPEKSGMRTGAVVAIACVVIVSIGLIIAGIVAVTSQNTQQPTNAVVTQPSRSSGNNTVVPDTSSSSSQDHSAPVTPSDDMIVPLRRYAEGMLANDPAAQASAYGPYIEKYYQHYGVDRAYVQNDKQMFIDGGNRVTSLTLKDLTLVSSTDTMAVIRYVRDVTWENSSGSIHKDIRSLVHLQRFDDGWKIVYEYDSP